MTKMTEKKDRKNYHSVRIKKNMHNNCIDFNFVLRDLIINKQMELETKRLTIRPITLAD